MANLSHAEACKFIDKIRVRNGGLEDSVRNKTAAVVLEALDGLRNQLAASTEILATELYTKSSRFVYELIQNAEDNSYTNAQAEGSDPFLRFSIDQDKIVIDANEDGFTEEDVRAICEVRTSTKKGVRGYIGEKGIGFKSVFTVASKVHVQSGPFAFYFKYAGENDGMGMVTPFNSKRAELPNDVRTRFILTLKNKLENTDLVKEFKDLPDTLLLFLTTLKTLRVSIVYQGESLIRSFDSKFDKARGVRSLSRVSNKERFKSLHFFVRQRTVRRLPPDKAREGIEDADVILAFPVDGNSFPVTEQQHVCAFLPLRKIGFSFQIQSDFITQASREDVLDNAWNQALLVGVAEVFVDAMIGFCDNASLQYLWPKYLPIGLIVDPFWKQLKELIINLLRSKPVLRSLNSADLKCIKELRYLRPGYLDIGGKPLFRDLMDEIYLSSKYSEEDVSILHKIGLKDISIDEFWDRVRSDLKSPNSRMKSQETSADWHTRSSTLILSKVKLPSTLLQIVQAFEMLPLQDGLWTSIAAGPVYYHEIAGVDVPLDLGLRILDPGAGAHSGRRELFDAVGVKYCNSKDIKNLIVKRYARWDNVDLKSSVSHMAFLFHHSSESEESVDEKTFLFDAEMTPVYRTNFTLGRPEMIVDDIYFSTPGAYSIAALRQGPVRSKPHNIHIIHPAYMTSTCATSSVHSRQWADWLERWAGVLSAPRLVDPRDEQSLSTVFKWITTERRNCLLGVLRTHWKAYSASLTAGVISALQRVVLGTTSNKLVPLQDTFLPLPDLLNVATNLGVERKIPFLKLPSGFDGELSALWDFLGVFQVKLTTNLDFYLEALRASRYNCAEAFSQQRPKILEIYRAIEERANVGDYERLRKFFDRVTTIHLRDDDDDSPDDSDWTSPLDCVWKGPDYLKTHFVLAGYDDYKMNENCSRLFTSILKISDADCSHTLKQLAYEKNSDDEFDIPDKDHIARMYRDLLANAEEGTEWDTISEQFQEESLVYLGQNEWHSPSECIWSDYTYIPGMLPLARQYPDLKDFFVGRLGVKSPTLESQVQELQALCEKQSGLANVSQVIALMKEINLLKPNADAVRNILNNNIIPVKNERGRETLLRPIDTFVIVDREIYGPLFAGKVATFAMSVGELRSVRTLLSVLGLDNRYMSRLIKEDSEVENAVPDPTLTKDFGQRAYALMRCAKHFESPQAELGDHELLHSLKNVTVFQSNEVKRTVKVELDGRVLARQTTRGIVHLENEGDSGLEVYVPKDSMDREICYHKKLPERLVTHWSITDFTAVMVIANILNMSIGALDNILSEHGIPEMPDVQQLLDAGSDQGDEDTYTTTGYQAVRHTYDRSLSNPLRNHDMSKSNYVTTDSTSSIFTQSRAITPEYRNTSVFAERQGSGSRTPVPVAEQDFGEVNARNITEYRNLLDGVINASGRARFPSKFDYQASNNSVSVSKDLNTVFGVRSQDTMAHDKKIGAAGELFAFEMLRNHTKNFCGIENWQSTIRDCVSVHEKYHDLLPWTGKETADIVFEDQASLLTKKLITWGYLTGDWQGKTPTYFLEVKSTTGSCDTRFFMSKAQIRRMREMRLEPGKDSPNIYVILRVYNLADDSIGMRILVDPATMEQDKNIKIEAESYTVLQNDGPSSTSGLHMPLVMPNGLS